MQQCTFIAQPLNRGSYSARTFPVSGEESAMGQKTSKLKAAKATGTTTQTVCEWIVDTIKYYIDFTC